MQLFVEPCIVMVGNSNLLNAWPLLGTNPRRASKHIVDLISTRLGNMRRVPSGLRSKQQERARKLAKLLDSVHEREASLEDEVEPTTAEARCHQVYLLIINTENMEGISFTDISGPLPYTSVRGFHYIFFLYSYDANAIFMTNAKSR